MAVSVSKTAGTPCFHCLQNHPCMLGGELGMIQYPESWEEQAVCNGGATWCCVWCKQNWEHAMSIPYRERAFCFLNCCAIPCMEHRLCDVSPAWLYENLPCLYLIDWKSAMLKSSALLWLHSTSKLIVFSSVKVMQKAH